MLEKIRIQGFRALKDVEISLPPGKPLVLIGENASGKSSILDGVAMICAAAGGRAGRAILDRGGWAAVAWAGTSTEIELLTRFSERSPVFQRERAPVEYMIRFGSVRASPTVLDEEVRVYKNGFDQRPFIALKGGAASWAANVQTKKNDIVAPVESDSAMLTNSSLAAISDEVRYPTPMHVKEALQSIAFYPSFALGAAPDGVEGAHEPIGARPVERTRRIKRSGRDLLNALHTLSQEYADTWSALLADLQAVFPWCDEMRFPPGPGRGVITLTWRDKRSGATLYLDDMSEGMRVYLAMLAALHAPDSPALIAFDEPERSLHPRAMRRLVKVMESRAEKTPILVATHADRLLDHLEDPAASLGITRFSSDAGVTVETLDGELLDAWLKEYSLSELRARGMLESPPQDGTSVS
ncbi:AAA family ATPase [Sorangium sp. So ce124]|uniref:AAA family ATPase n=1 Tax=Sorangium sp. So ce124 TaxID=3133280 RepID=UPI003F5DF881